MTKDKGVVFLCVTQEDYETVNRFVKEQSYTFPVYLLAGNLPESFKTDIIPATYILSPDGKVAFKHTGAAKWDDQASVAFLESLIKQNY